MKTKFNEIVNEKKSEKKRALKVGNTVEIIGNIPFELKDKQKPILGKITNIDGAYILVKPKYQRHECEFYSGELKYVSEK